MRWADPADPENSTLSDDRTRAFFGETLPNPKLQVFPIGEVAQIGEELGIPLIVDNTAAPIICKPIKHGAHVVIHSTTKYIGGHGSSIGGVILDSGAFDWEKHKARFPLLNTPDQSYHGAVWVEAVKPLGPIAFILKARVTVQRDYGFALSPQKCLSIHPGPGNPRPALRAAEREHGQGCRLPRQPPGRHPRDLCRQPGRRG